MNFILLLREDDSYLKVSWQVTFRKVVVYKTVAYKKIKLYLNILGGAPVLNLVLAPGHLNCWKNNKIFSS